jgi:hypothetical protein
MIDPIFELGDREKVSMKFQSKESRGVYIGVGNEGGACAASVEIRQARGHVRVMSWQRPKLWKLCFEYMLSTTKCFCGFLLGFRARDIGSTIRFVILTAISIQMLHSSTIVRQSRVAITAPHPWSH